MIHYKDRTFCNAGPLCRDWDCDKRVQQTDILEARKLDLPICCINFATAKCFVPWFVPESPVNAVQREEVKRRAAGYMALKDVGNVCPISSSMGMRKQGSGKKKTTKRRTGRGVIKHGYVAVTKH